MIDLRKNYLLQKKEQEILQKTQVLLVLVKKLSLDLDLQVKEQGSLEQL